jgi:hypothetical protein
MEEEQETKGCAFILMLYVGSLRSGMQFLLSALRFDPYTPAVGIVLTYGRPYPVAAHGHPRQTWTLLKLCWLVEVVLGRHAVNPRRSHRSIPRHHGHGHRGTTSVVTVFGLTNSTYRTVRPRRAVCSAGLATLLPRARQQRKRRRAPRRRRATGV